MDMNGETVESVEQTAGSQAEMEAAFAASFNGDDVQVEQTTQSTEEEVSEVAQKDEEQATPEVTQEAPPTPVLTEDQLKLLSAIPELEKRLTQQVDRVAGNYGELKRLLTTMQKAAATPEGAASAEATEALDTLDEEFPELAGSIAARVKRELQKALPSAVDPEKLGQMVKEAVVSVREQEEVERRATLITSLDEIHPDRKDLQATPEWKEWIESLPASTRAKFLRSWDLDYVAEKVDEFKVWREQKAKVHQKNQKRVADAVTPAGVKPTGPSTITEREEMERAFEAEFNS